MNYFAIAPVQAGIADWAQARTMLPPQLTPVQIRIIAFIHHYQQMWGESPLYREIGRNCGLRSESAVAYQIRRLVELGMLLKPARLVRAIRLAIVPAAGGPG